LAPGQRQICRGSRISPYKEESMRRILVALAIIVVALALPALALAGSGNGTSESQGANSTGNSVSSGATPQPK